MNTKTCPVCGKKIGADAPQGLCPECLMQAALASGTSVAAGAAPRVPFTPPTPAELAPHFPALEITALIGQGGMGVVYQARQRTLDRRVALKILPPDTRRDPQFTERFTREARALARLNHPHIVAVHDFGVAGGFHYLVMEFVDGPNLRTLLDAGRLAPPQALAIVSPLCSALQYAHDRGIVHRDIKPENILLTRDGTAKIADFGLAKLIDADAGAGLTGARDVMGTPHYMAPEQIEQPHAVDHRADIYSLGVVLYQMLTGELPLGRFAPPSRKVAVDVRLDEVVLRALEKEPARRYQQATGLQTDVEAVTRTPPPVASAAAQATNARADGRLLVVPLRDARLPLRCVKTNAPVAAQEVRRLSFEWIPPVVWLAWLATPIVFFVLYLLVRQKVQLDVPLSAAGAQTVRRHRLWSVAAMISAAVLLMIAVGESSPALVLLALVIALGGCVGLLLHGPALRLVRVEDDRAWLVGAHPAFLAALPR